MRDFNDLFREWQVLTDKLNECPPVILGQAELNKISDRMDRVEGLDTSFQESYQTLANLTETAWNEFGGACTSWPSGFSQDPVVILNQIKAEAATQIAAVGSRVSRADSSHTKSSSKASRRSS